MQPPSSVASVAGIMCVSSTFLLVAILMGHLACAAAAAGSSTPQLPKLAGKFEEIDGTEVVSQLPEQQPKGVLLAFHGCSHAATDWWPQSATCAACIGGFGGAGLCTSLQGATGTAAPTANSIEFEYTGHMSVSCKMLMWSILPLSLCCFVLLQACLKRC